MTERLFTFVGGNQGLWKVIKLAGVIGPGLDAVEWLDVVVGTLDRPPDGSLWLLRGITSYERYVNSEEAEKLKAAQVAVRTTHCDLCRLDSDQKIGGVVGAATR